MAVISLDSAPKKDENYYLQVFLKVCKYTEKKVISHINGNVSIFLLLIILMILKLWEYVLNFGLQTKVLFVMGLANKSLYTLIK